MAVFGNDKVVANLERMLAEARKGQYGFLTIMMVGNDQRPMGGWYGSSYLQAAGMIALQSMGSALAADVANKLPPRDENATADRVCYNIPLFSMCYDFINWLVDAEMVRRIEGAPAPLKVCFWQGRDGKTGLDDTRRRMLENVMRPALALVGAVEDETAASGRSSPQMSFRGIIEKARQGHEVPRLRVPWRLKNYLGVITITLRECEHFPYRNSDIEEWLKFAEWLKAKGERVIFVRDTSQAQGSHSFFGFETCPLASFDLHYRAALYESAKMNLFVSNGPAALGFFSDWPWMCFMPMHDDSSPYEPNTPKFWREHVGVEMGEQFPWWRSHDQRIVWKEDTFENMVEAWESLPKRCVA